MSDDKSLRDNRDKSKVDANDRGEVEALHQQWKQFSHAQIIDAIKTYGPNREDIEAHLSRQAEVL